MSTRVLAAWSLSTATVALLSTQPVVRGLAVLVAIDVAVTLVPRERALGPLLRLAGWGALSATVISLLLAHRGGHAWVTLPDGIPGLGGPLTLESLAFGADAGLGLAATMLATAPLALAVDPHDLLDALPPGIERMATAIAAALSLVPGIARSHLAIRDAQRMRGLGGRGPRSWAAVLVPVAVTAMEDSIQLAESMEARGWGSGPRTRWPGRSLSRADLLVLATTLAAMAIAGTARATGALPDWGVYPTVAAPAVPVAALAALALLVTPVRAWRRSASAR